jgi:hypothetical protein
MPVRAAYAIGADPLDREDLGSMDKPIDERDDAGGVGEDLVPFAKRLVRSQN